MLSPNGKSKSDNDYLAGLPEQLVIRGLRAWMFGLEFNDVQCLNAVSDFYENILGGRTGACCNALMGRWARSLWRDTPHKLSFYPPCCRYLTHDECMAVGIVAALQHGDQGIARVASEYMLRQSHDSGPHEHLHQGADLASALSDCGQRLLYIPKTVVESISAMSAKGSSTCH